MTRPTLILTRREISTCMPLGDYVESVSLAFSRYAEGKMHVPEVVHVPGHDGAFHVKSAGFSDEPFHVAVKINGNFPENPGRHGLPTIQGAILLADARDGFPLAILDSQEITAMRTAAATAVAARHLADPESHIATLIGCGAQARMQLDALRLVLPIRTVFVHDLDRARAWEFADVVARATGLTITPLDDFAEGTTRSQVIVTCTTSRRAFLEPGHAPAGAFVAAVGADNPQKQEVSPELMRRARVIVDVLEQCAEIGELHHALVAGVMKRSDVHAELGEVVRGAKPGRQSSEQIVVFDSTGSAIQDVAAAGRIFERAVEKNLGTRVELG